MSLRVRLSAAVVLLVALTGCGGPDAVAPKADSATSQQSTANLTVKVEPAKLGPLTTTYGASGTVAAWQLATVSAEISGYSIRQVLVAEGDVVKKGQVLARLGTEQLQAQIDEQIATNQGRQASLDAAQFSYDRGVELSSKGNLSKEDMETRQSTLATAKSSLAEGQAALKALQAQLAQGTIVAPVDGRIVAAAPVLGTVVQIGTELFKIVQDDRLEVQAKVPEQLLGRISAQQKVEVVDAAGRTISGTVRALAQQVDTTTRLGTVYVSLPNDSGVRVGMSAELEFDVPLGDVLSVPEAALAWRDNQAGVFAVDAAGKASFVKVATGAHQNGRVVISAGLTAGQNVAVDGVGFLNDGTQVRVAAASKTAAG